MSFRPVVVGVLVLSGLLTSGCAHHKPMSEAIVLRHSRTPMGDAPVSFVGVAAVSHTSAEDAIEDHQLGLPANDTATGVKTINPFAQTIGLYYLRMSRTDRSAFSVSLGFPALLGIDYTASAGGKLYYTISASLVGGGRLISQRVLVSRRNFGLSAGIELRGSFYAYDIDKPNSSAVWRAPENMFVPTAGFRLNTLFERPPVGPAGIISVFTGYAFLIRQPVLGIEVSIGTL